MVSAQTKFFKHHYFLVSYDNPNHGFTSNSYKPAEGGSMSPVTCEILTLSTATSYLATSLQKERLQACRRKEYESSDLGNTDLVHRYELPGYKPAEGESTSPINELCVSGVYSADGWGVNYSSSSICALKGSTVIINCTYKYPTGYQIMKVFWTNTNETAKDEEFPDLSNVSEYSQRIQYLGDKHHNCTMRLTDVRQTDSHKYYFRFITNKPKWVGKPGVTLNITDLQVESSGERVIEGHSVTLTCKSRCSLTDRSTFIWFKNTQSLSERTDRNNQLILQSVTRNDSGNYSCAVQGHKLTSPHQYLNVVYAPDKPVISINPSGEIVEGVSVTLTCSSESNPPVQNYSWFKENETSSVGSGLTYSITNISGWFYCEAQNEVGSQRSAAVSLNVKVLNITQLTNCTKTSYIKNLLDQIENITVLNLKDVNKVMDMVFSTSEKINTSSDDPKKQASYMLKASEKLVSTLVRPTNTYYYLNFTHAAVEEEMFVVGPQANLDKIPQLHTSNASIEIDLIGIANLNSGSAAVVFMSYNKMEDLLKPDFFSTSDNTVKTMMSTVISATLPKTTNATLTKPVNFTFKHIRELNDSGTLSCVYWNITEWIVDGCSVVKTNSSFTVCSCVHLSTFALIMQTSSRTSEDNSQPMELVNMVLVIVGLVFTSLALLTFAFCRWKPGVNNVARINLCISLLSAHLLFLLTQQFINLIKPHKELCAVISGALHFFFLSCFVWMFIEAVLLFICVKNISQISSRQRAMLNKGFLIVIGYAIDFVIVGVSAGLVPEGYGSDKCWIKVERGFIWSFLGPVYFILAINTILFISIIISLNLTLKNLNLDVSHRRQTNKMMEILFLILNSQQGTFIFLVYCVLNNEIWLMMMSVRMAPPPLPLIVLLIVHRVYSADDEWGVNYSPTSICALKGSTVIINCTYKYPTGYKIMKVFWTKINSPDPPDLSEDSKYSQRIQYLGDKHHDCTMRLTDVRQTDSHKYYFRFITDKDKWLGRPGVTLNITDLQVESSGERVIEGHSVTLTCKSRCSLTDRSTFIWFKNTQSLSERTDRNNQLILQSVRREDSGNYSCAVQGNNFTSPHRYLNIMYAPKQTHVVVNPSGEIMEGDSVNLSCSSDANPPVQNYSWFKGGEILGSGSTYIISNISSDHSGEYKCKSSNELGMTFSDSVILNVIYAPDKPVISINPSEIMEGDLVNLTCSSDANPPVQNYSWFKKNKTVASGQTYIISKIRSDHSGEYKCKSINELGKRYSAVTLNVLYPPKNVTASISGSGEIMEGDSVTLTCSSESNPPVQIYSWFKENETSSVGSGQTYSITNINFRHSGWFYCEAQNEVGSQRSDAVSINVKVASCVSFSVAFGVGLCVGVCGTLATVIVGMYICKRKSLRRKTSKHKPENDDASNDTYTALELKSRSSDLYDTLTPNR
nr:uncharacterized protein LOC129445229 [Misgurnus anguillicaudatus]